MPFTENCLEKLGPSLLYKFPYMGESGNLSILYSLLICSDKQTSVRLFSLSLFNLFQAKAAISSINVCKPLNRKFGMKRFSMEPAGTITGTLNTVQKQLIL